MRLNTSLCSIAGALLVVSASVVLASQPFEGTKWKVKVTPDEQAITVGEKEFDDTLIFKGGKFMATECAKYGFKPAEYNEEMAPGGHAASFTAELKSDKEGTAKWHGTTAASEMRGEMTWTKKDGTVLNYTFKGERVAK